MKGLNGELLHAFELLELSSVKVRRDVFAHVMFSHVKFLTNRVESFVLRYDTTCNESSQQINPLTPRVKPWVIQSFLTFDSMDRTLKCDHIFIGKLLSSTLLCCGLFNFTQFVILEN